MKVHFVYILYSATRQKFYIGETKDPVTRLAQHNAGKVPSTKPYRPWVFAWLGEKETRTEALRLERKLKNLKSRKRLVAFIKHYGKWEFEDI